jgi:hypothetical protein
VSVSLDKPETVALCPDLISPSNFCADNVLQRLHGDKYVHPKRPEHVAYIRELESLSFVEQYRDGNLSLIFDMPTEFNRDLVGRLLGSSPCGSLHNFPMLIFHLDALSGRKFNNGQEQSVLVINVQDVNAPDRVIPSLVRLYFVEDKFEKSGRGAVYFNPTKRTFHLLSYRENGEFGLIVGARRTEFGQNRHPCVIESAMEIVDGISKDQSNVVNDLIPITKVMLQHFISTVRIYLDRSRVTIWQSGNDGFQFSDVMLGPVDFQAGTLERG